MAGVEARDGSPVADVRRITSAKEMRALAHPLRWKLLEVLDLESQATAAECARMLRESHSLCSYHLRQLAKYDLVEQVETTSQRDRPWRLTHRNLSIPTEPTGQPEKVAVTTLRSLIAGHELELLEGWIQHQFDYPPAWRRASVLSGSQIWLTPEELLEVRQSLLDVITAVERRKRHEGRRDASARPVRLLLAGYPIEYQAADSE